MGFNPNIPLILTIDPNFQRDIQVDDAGRLNHDLVEMSEGVLKLSYTVQLQHKKSKTQ